MTVILPVNYDHNNGLKIYLEPRHFYKMQNRKKLAYF